MSSPHRTRLPLLGLCLAAALATACAGNPFSGRSSQMGSSATGGSSTTGSSSTTGGSSAMGASGGYVTRVPSPTGASGPMDRTPNATGGTASGTEGGSGTGN